MGACATKPGDLKVKGEAPVVLEDDTAEKKAGGVVPAVEADPAADASRRRSLSDLLKEDVESGGEAPEAEKNTDETGATEEQPLAVEPSIATAEQACAGGGDAKVVEEEKRVDPDSAQVAAAVSPEESKAI